MKYSIRHSHEVLPVHYSGMVLRTEDIARTGDKYMKLSAESLDNGAQLGAVDIEEAGLFVVKG